MIANWDKALICLSIIERLSGFDLDTNLFAQRQAIFYQFNNCVYAQIVLLIDSVKDATGRLNRRFYEIHSQFRSDDCLGVFRHQVLRFHLSPNAELSEKRSTASAFADRESLAELRVMRI